MEQVRVCRICGHVNPLGDRTRCSNCWSSLAETTPVTRTEGRRIARRLRLGFLRNRFFRIGFLLAAAIGFTVWGVLVFFDLGPNPPAATTDLSPSTAPETWAQGRRTAQNTGYTPDQAPVPRQVIWTYESSRPIFTSPAIADDHVYLTTEDGRTVALDRETGQQVWEYVSGFPSSSTPAVVDDMVIFSVRKGVVIGLDRQDGSFLWRTDVRGSILGSPIVADGSVYFGTADKELYALDAATGEVRWNLEVRGWIVSSAAYSDNTVSVTSQDGLLHIVDTKTGLKRFVYDAGWAITGGPTIHGDLVYFGTHSGTVWAIDRWAITYAFERAIWYWELNLFAWHILPDLPLQKGTVWFKRIGDRVFTTPAVAHGTVYAASGDGNVVALDAVTGEERWTTSLSVPITAAPSVAGDTVLVGAEDGRVFGLSAHSGEVTWDFQVGNGALINSSLVAGDVMYVVSGDGKLHALAGAE